MALQNILEEISSRSDEWSQILGVKQEIALSPFFETSQIQDASRFRHRHYAASLASYLISEEGVVDRERVSRVLSYLQGAPYSLVPGREEDHLLFSHFIEVIGRLSEQPLLLEKFQLPLCHKKAEEFIKDTVQKRKITNGDLRRAVLSAWLTPLRQNVGSCFATAPAILLQRRAPQFFLKDLQDLLLTGRLSRTIAGKEYTVPLSPSWGMGDLLRPLAFFDFFRLSYSPALISSLMYIGAIPEEMPWEDKQRACYQILLSYQEERPQNLKELLREALLQKIGLSEEEMQKEKTRSKMTFLTENIHPFAYQALSTSAKEKKVEKFEELWEGMLASFRTWVDHPLLKAWEFSLASLSDVKLTFARWNLYISLGLDPKEAEGFGAFLLHLIETRLESANREMQEHQYRHEQAHGRARSSEALLQRSTDERQIHSLHAEMQSALHEMQSALTMRDLAYKRAELLSQLLGRLLEGYYELFQEYFQELYDPEITLASLQSYHDSPAGFSLVYKHGRKDPSSWSRVLDAEKYVSFLREFFHQTEQRVLVDFPEEIKKDLSSMITEMILFLQTPAFLEGALRRAAALDPGGKRKPWSYISGGTMETLLKAYFRREEGFHTLFTKVEGEEELMDFYLKAEVMCREESSPQGEELLAFSPTHSFLFLPSLQEKSREGGFLKGKQFFAEISLDQAAQHTLLEEISLPYQDGVFKVLFPRHREMLSVSEFGKELVHALRTAYKKAPMQERFDWEKVVDGFLYSALPLQTKEEALEHMRIIYHGMGLSAAISQRALDKAKKLVGEAVLTSKKFQNYALASLLFSTGKLFHSHDLASLFLQKARDMRLSYPQPLLFADTNWPSSFFAWVVGPRSLSWELWALGYSGTNGFPMNDWKMFFDGSQASEWGVYDKISEYS